MAKKSANMMVSPIASEEKPAAPPLAEVMPAEATEAERPDPTLLGVSVPLNVTFAAARQVADAWRACAKALVEAIKAKLERESTTAVEPSAPAA